MKRNRVLKKITAGQPVLIGNVSPFASAKATELMGIMGFDGVWIDYEHHDMTDHDIFHACLGASATGCTPIVRTRGSEPTSFFHPLEQDAEGLIVPHVKTAEQATWAVRNARFIPDGLRGMDGVEVSADCGLLPMKDYMHQANERIILIAQIEDREALENLDAIIACPGINGYFIGPADLSQSLGIPLQFTNSRLTEVYDRVSETCAKHGEWWGAPVFSEEHAGKLLSQGARFLPGAPSPPASLMDFGD